MRVAVVGGGIAGLAAAWELTGHQQGPAGPEGHQQGPAGPEGHQQGRGSHEVTVFEPGPLGGKIQTELFLGRRVDTGADAFIARVPEGVALARELGLESELVAPGARRAQILVGGRLHPLPEGLVLGAPARLRPLLGSGILSPLGLVRAGLDLVLPPTAWPDDVSVAELVRRRFGAQVAKRLVDPLIGGIHAGDTEHLSAQSTAPQLVHAARGHRSLLLGLRALPTPAPGPLFLAPRGGMGRLVDRLVEALVARGVHFQSVAVGKITGEKGGPVLLDPGGAFDGAVLATPTAVGARLVRDVAPEAAAGLAGIGAASVVLTTLAYRRTDLPVPDGISGFLVARGEGRLMTACSFGSAKWPHWSDPDTVVVRVSAGRAGDERALELSDEEIVDRLQREVAGILATTAEPIGWRVTRWRHSFPQYDVGHGARITRIESALRQVLPGVALAGAGLRGSGIPACIASGRRAARLLTAPTSGT